MKSFRGSGTVSCLREDQGSGWSLVALTVFKTVRDLTTSGWVGSIPMHSRQSGGGRRQQHNFDTMVSILFRHFRILAVAASLVVVGGRASIGAQRPDSATRPVTVTAVPAVPLSALQAPIGARRAFLYSFLAPGYSQALLGRNKAAAAFVLVEAISIAMIRESGADLHEARRTQNDTVIVSYVDQNGEPFVTKAPPRFNDKYVRTRAAHVEDWIALLVANHLFSGADAFVAANLWDIPVRLGLRILPETGGAAVTAAFRW